MTAAPARYGVPERLRSDNRPEFIAACMQDWLEAQEIKTLYIKPASPWENGYIESFHDKLRDECLNRELFGNLREARLSWRVGGSNTINVARTARLTTEPRTSMPGPTRTHLMGAARPQSPRRSPWQASTPQGGKQTKNKTQTNAQNFSYEVCQFRGHGKGM